MLFTGVRIFLGEKGFVPGSLAVSEGRIREILPAEEAEGHMTDESTGETITEEAADKTAAEDEIEDLHGAYVIPGLVDIHTHGNSGEDFSDGSAEGLRKMGRYLASHGITAFAPTSMTLPYEELEKAFRTAADYMKERPADGARVAGIHMEGPYFSEKRKGAQSAEYLKLPDIEEFRKLQEACEDAVRIVDVAPELEGAEAFIREAAKTCKVSVAHTDAAYEDARMAFEAGASHVTHLFNAMPPIHHRKPGVIPAAAERDDVAVELICDGIHIHPAVVRMVFQLFPGRVCLISDAMRGCGMPDGEYVLGGQKVVLRDGLASLADGTIAGAARNLFEDMVNAIRFGIRPEEAVLAATLTPAKELGMETEIGSLAAGKKANFIVCDENWKLMRVYLDGVRIR